MKHIADIIERGIRDHPELSVGMQTEGIEVRWRLSLIGQRVKCRPLNGLRVTMPGFDWSKSYNANAGYLLVRE